MKFLRRHMAVCSPGVARPCLQRLAQHTWFMACPVILVGLLGTAAWGQEQPAEAEGDRPRVGFSRDIQPILAKRCFTCHGPETAESGLRLNQREMATGLLESGEHAIVPGEPEKSELLRRISSDDEFMRMPPEGKPLSQEQIELIRRWIAEGAQWEEHWAFQPPVAHAPPDVQNSDWVRTPIDAFILAQLEQNHLQPAPPAEKRVLLRRIYYDLIGLPPTPQEVEAFLADDSPNAYEKVVDRLLESPRYGERWARHWLDVVRFAETNSFERDGVKPNAWRYRDYVIRSFNEDKPYDQFIREQLAGDELPEVTPETIIATGYYRLGLWDDEPADPLQARYDELDDIVTTTGQVFLGLTIDCARCHDHKIDPIPQTDYYQMLAFFHGLRSYGTRSDQRSFNQTEISPPDVIARHEELNRKKDELRQQMAAIEELGLAKMADEVREKAEQAKGNERTELLNAELPKSLSAETWQKYAELKSEHEKLQAVELPPRTFALSVNKCAVEPPQTHVLLRGNPHVPGDEVQPGFPRIFGQPDPVIPPPPENARSSGRRLVLANWIASSDNMLTGRVMVNRIWQHHFGRGIVASPNNFGQLGEVPTHPKLLDWLALKFVDNGWRMKPLHKLIVMSSTYRMSSRANQAAFAKDPENTLIWRFNMRRLSAEEIRDSVQAVNGRLNLKMYGPGIYPDISEEVMAGQSQPGKGWGKSALEEQARRSIYIHVKRSLITPILANFDFPETDSSCAARFATTQPSQALGLLNGEFINREAAEFAKRLRREAGEETEAQVERALYLALCREPTEKDVQRGLQLIRNLQDQYGASPGQALDYFCLMVLNLNEFAYLD